YNNISNVNHQVQSQPSQKVYFCALQQFQQQSIPTTISTNNINTLNTMSNAQTKIVPTSKKSFSNIIQSKNIKVTKNDIKSNPFYNYIKIAYRDVKGQKNPYVPIKELWINEINKNNKSLSIYLSTILKLLELQQGMNFKI